MVLILHIFGPVSDLLGNSKGAVCIQSRLNTLVIFAVLRPKSTLNYLRNNIDFPAVSTELTVLENSLAYRCNFILVAFSVTDLSYAIKNFCDLIEAVNRAL